MNALTKQAASFSESMIPQCLENAAMDPTLFDTYGVKRGLRDKAGNGVVAGLTNISDVSAYWFDEHGNKHPQEGKLSYRGYNINDLVNGFVREKRFGFEETTYPSPLLRRRVQMERTLDSQGNHVKGDWMEVKNSSWDGKTSCVAEQ